MWQRYSRVLALTVVLLAPGLLPAREWSDSTGQFRIEAKLAELKDGKAYLKRPDGNIVPVALDNLSKADLE